MTAALGTALADAMPRRAPGSAPLTEATPTVGDRNRVWGHFTRRQSIALAFMREHVPGIRELERGPWACLQAIASHWQAGRTDAYPGQERLAMLTGYDVRSIRTFTRTLESAGLLDVVRLTLADGTARLHYEPGSVLLAAVERFDARYSDDRERAVAPHGKRRNPPDAPEMVSGGGAATVSGELPDPGPENSSFCSAVASEEHGGKEEQGLNVSPVDQEVAREALATLRKRRFGCTARLFDAKDVQTVAVCVSTVDGDREVKMRAQRDAIDHAFGVSRGPPSPSYIWGSIDHFLEHEAAGRSSREESERARVRQERAAEAERTRAREWARREREVCGPPPEVLRVMEELWGGKRRSSSPGSRFGA
jgi:hypothetical protein